MKHELAMMATAALLLAQANSYNGGIPITPGTSVPESNPAIDRPAPRPSASSGVPAASTGTGFGSGVSSGSSGPAYSFGAAPPPVVGPSH